MWKIAQVWIKKSKSFQTNIGVITEQNEDCNKLIWLVGLDSSQVLLNCF